MEELAPGLLSIHRPGESFDTVFNEIFELSFLASIKPESVFFLACVDFQRVRPVVEGNHLLRTHRASKVTASFCILDCAFSHIGIGSELGLELVEFMVIYPATVAILTVVDLYAFVALYRQVNLTAWTLHV